MKEMLKSRIMILFVVMVLGVTYMGSLKSERLEDENLEEYYTIMVANIK